MQIFLDFDCESRFLLDDPLRSLVSHASFDHKVKIRPPFAATSICDVLG